MTVRLLESQPTGSQLTVAIISSINVPWRQMAKSLDQLEERGDWHDLVASLEAERHVLGSKFKATYHVAEEDEHPLCPAIVSTIENITTHNYPFWRVRCKVTD